MKDRVETPTIPMSESWVCPQCGKPICGDLAAEICPRCIMEAVILDTRATVGRDDSGNRVEGTSGSLPEPKQPRYEKGHLIAKGGMGEVLEVRELPVGRRVAMKVINEAQHKNAEVRARFIEEAQITGQLEHPSIVPMHDLSIDDRGNVFYTMKRLEGQTLAAILDQLKRGEATVGDIYPLSRLLTIFQKVCDAIAFAHSRGVIHRDLKPENIMVGEFGEVMVMDWGLARVLNLPDLEITLCNPGGGDEKGFFLHTTDGNVEGTVGYMAPEQAAGIKELIGFTSDIYALGAILYEILTLTRSVQANSLEEGFSKTISEKIIPPSETGIAKRAEHCPWNLIPQSLSAVTMRAMAKDPADRYETVEKLQQEIEAYQNGFATAAEEADFLKHLQLFVGRHKVESIALFLVGMIILASSVFLLEAWRQADELRVFAETEKGKAETATRIAEDRADVITRNLYIAEMNLASEAANRPDGLKQVFEATSNWLPENGETDYRGWEWYYFISLLHHEAATLTGHTDRVTSVAFNPDGRTIASAGRDKSIRFWDAATRKQTSIIQDSQSISTIAWSPDGARLASAGGWPGSVKIWDPGGEEEPLLLKGHEKEVISLSWNPEGTLLASGSQDLTARVWDAASGDEVQNFRDNGDRIKAVGSVRVNWRPQGDLLAITGGGRPGRFLDVKSGRLVKEAGFRANSFQWSPDGTRFAMASHQLGVWDASTWSPLFRLSDFGGPSALSWSPDGSMLTSGKMAIHLWDSVAGKELSILRGHLGSVRSVDWNPNGLELASAGDDKTVKIWDLRPILSPSPLCRSTDVRSVSWSADGLKFAAGTGNLDSEIEIWEAKTGRKVFGIPFPCEIPGSPPCCAWSPKGNLIAAVNRENVAKVWDSESYEEVVRLDTEPAHIFSSKATIIDWSPRGDRLAYFCNSSHLALWEAGKSQVVTRIPVGRLRSVSWHPEGKFLVLVESTGIRVLESESWTEVIRNTVRNATLLSIEWSPDGSCFGTGDNQGGFKIWDPSTLKVIASLSGHSGGVEAIAWSPDGNRIATGSNDETIKIWDPSGRQLLTISGDFSSVYDLKWSPDGTRLLGAFRGQCVTIWDATKGYLVERNRVNGRDGAQ